MSARCLHVKMRCDVPHERAFLDFQSFLRFFYVHY